MSKVTVFETNC